MQTPSGMQTPEFPIISSSADEKFVEGIMSQKIVDIDKVTLCGRHRSVRLVALYAKKIILLHPACQKFDLIDCCADATNQQCSPHLEGGIISRMRATQEHQGICSSVPFQICHTYHEGSTEPGACCFCNLTVLVLLFECLCPSNAHAQYNYSTDIKHVVMLQGALRKCDREKRKCITADDLIWTLKTSSDYSHYTEVVRAYTQRYRAAEATERLSKRQEGATLFFC